MAIRLSVAHTVKNNYPENILVDGDQDTMTKRWRARVFLMQGGKVHKLLLVTPYLFEFQQRAIDTAKTECAAMVADPQLN